MKAAQNKEFISFKELLEEKLDADLFENLDRSLRNQPERHSPRFTEGADLGPGLLSELFHLLRKPNRLPENPARTQPFSEEKLPPHSAKTAKTMTSAEKEALDFFNSEGESDLTPDSSAREFKSAFRRLALKLHPDAHPKATNLEKTIWSHKFRKLKEMYPRLKALGEREP